MDELIPIIDNGENKAVDARTFHEFLQVGKDFSTWIKDRIEKYGFSEGVDYEVLPEIGEADFKGLTKKDYIISLDMAKELAMVEKNDKGKQARKYFIEIEKKAVALQSALAPLTHEEMMLQVMTTLQLQVAEQKAIAEEAIKTKAWISDKKTAQAFVATMYDGYEVNIFGEVRSVDRVCIYSDGRKFIHKGKTLNQYYGRGGYYNIKVSVGGKHKTINVHRLVAETFIENPHNKPQVNHIDGDKTNNNVNNLEWATQSENTQHAYDNNLITVNRGSDAYNSILTDSEVIEIRMRYEIENITHKQLSCEYGVTKGTIGDICRRQRWKHLS